jgi:8-oxo-dGTP diphosphatase
MARDRREPSRRGAPILKSVRGDGDGWVVSYRDTYHWGLHGAAGLLLRAPWHDGTPAVLLQHRALWSHQGGTWGLPGGALDSHEAAEHAAVREARWLHPHHRLHSAGLFRHLAPAKCRVAARGDRATSS